MFSIRTNLLLLFCALLFASGQEAGATEDWSRFLGNRGDATSSDSKVPMEWDSSTNLKWRTPLPGPGASSPIVVGDRVFLTCYTGYGDGSEGAIDGLVRHLICVDRVSGKILWTKAVKNPAGTDEDPYKSYITQHGYATNTPISDGKSVFVYFGKPGLIAFDFEGNELWRMNVKSKVTKTRWGSAASPIFYDGNLIVNAVEEDGHIYSVNPKDGGVNWKFDTKANLVYATPNVLKTKDGEMELVVPVPDKIIGLDANTGKEKWFANTTMTDEMNGSVIVDGDLAYIYGGYKSSGSIAIRGGGSGDVGESHVLWATKDTSYIATPVLSDGHIYWLDKSGIAYCVNVKTGERVHQKRTPGVRGGRGVKFFASMILCDGHVLAVSRRSGTFVLKATPDFPLVRQNKFAEDDSEFNGTPAISDNQLFLRSNKYLYCVGE